MSEPDPGYGLQSYETGAPTESNVSAIVLTILSFLSLCNLLTLGSLALGIIALAKRSTDPEGSRRLTRIGWIVFAVVWALVIVGIVAFIIFARVHSRDVPNFDSRV
jgi:cytochrome c biogenesis protein CcdA